MHSDSITLSQMRFEACHGALPFEKTQPQPWEVTVTLELSLQEAAQTDALGKTIDYREIHAVTRNIMEGPPLNLAEALAGRIAEAQLRAFPQVRTAIVEVLKAKPPVDFSFGGLRVRVCRERDNLS